MESLEWRVSSHCLSYAVSAYSDFYKFECFLKIYNLTSKNEKQKYPISVKPIWQFTFEH